MLVAVSEVRSCMLAQDANEIAKTVQKQQEKKDKIEQEKQAYLAFELGYTLTDFTGSDFGFTHQWSIDRLVFIQGTADRLGLDVDLR
jgi:hypothetical protein